jgi:ribosomal protein S18 acetylase RimI-like enzyme
MTQFPQSVPDLIRGYIPADRAACLRLFDGNVPRFFTVAERPDFIRFLERRPAADESYLVVERDGRVVACGGYAIAADGCTAGLCWGMVARDLHGQGLGRSLTEARLRAARAVPGVTQVTLDTSQHSQGFYAGLGFAVRAVRRDGYGPGLDRWDMLLRF